MFFDHLDRIVESFRGEGDWDEYSWPRRPSTWPSDEAIAGRRSRSNNPSRRPWVRTCSMSCAGCACHCARYATRNKKGPVPSSPKVLVHRPYRNCCGPADNGTADFIGNQTCSFSFIVAAGGGSPPGDTSCAGGLFCSQAVVVFLVQRCAAMAAGCSAVSGMFVHGTASILLWNR